MTAVTVWKSKQSMNPLGQCLFKERHALKATRSLNSGEIRPPVPGYPKLATNIMARIWNSIPDLHTDKTLGAARNISKKWARTIPR